MKSEYSKKYLKFMFYYHLIWVMVGKSVTGHTYITEFHNLLPTAVKILFHHPFLKTLIDFIIMGLPPLVIQHHMVWVIWIRKIFFNPLWN